MDTVILEYVIVAIAIVILAIVALFFAVFFSGWLARAEDAANEARSASRTRTIIEQATMLDYGRDMIANQEMSKVQDFTRERITGKEALSEVDTDELRPLAKFAGTPGKYRAYK